jgi:uncharacterized repeat protein (TIGR01451 family)
MRMLRHFLSIAAVLAAGAAFAQSDIAPDDPAVEFLPPADLTVSVDDGLDAVTPGQVVTWILTIDNVGINGLTGVVLTSAQSGSLSHVTWVCDATMGSQCTASGFNAPNDSVAIASRGYVRYRITATVGADATGTVGFSVSAAAPAGYIDVNPANNQSTDIDVVVRDVIFANGFQR